MQLLFQLQFPYDHNLAFFLLQNLYRRLYADVPELPPIPKSENIPNVIPIRPDMSVYDSVLQGGFPHG